MSKITKKQKMFLKTIKNEVFRQNQKQQFILQNRFDEFFSNVEDCCVTPPANNLNKFTKTLSSLPFFLKPIGDNKENSLSKKSLRGLTEPKIIETPDAPNPLFCTLDEMGLFKSNDNDYNNHWNNIAAKKISDVPKEFCVEITGDNFKVLSVVISETHSVNFHMPIGSYLNNDITVTKIGIVSVVSTEDFLTYIGKSDMISLIEVDGIPRISENLYDLGYRVLPESNDPKVNYHVVESSLPKKEYTLKDMEECFKASRSNCRHNNFENYLKTLK